MSKEEHNNDATLDSTKSLASSARSSVDQSPRLQLSESPPASSPSTPRPSGPVQGSPAPSASRTPRKGSLAPVSSDRPLKDPINIAIYEYRRDNPVGRWDDLADAINAQLGPTYKAQTGQSANQRYKRTVDAYSQLSAEQFEAMRRDSQDVEQNKAELPQLVMKARQMVDARGAHWQDVADFVNIRLKDAAEHLTAAQAQQIAEQDTNVRYDRLIAAAVARRHEKYWQDIADLVNFQLETVRDGKLSTEQVERVASGDDDP